MARIEGIRIQNFRSLKDVALGRLWSTLESNPLTPLTAVIGKNGVGKSALFDAFGFLADCLKLGLEEAFDGRGGYERVKSQGQDGPIQFYISYRDAPDARLIVYRLDIEQDATGRPFVENETLGQQRTDQSHEWPYVFLLLHEGKGVAWKGPKEGKLMKGELMDALQYFRTDNLPEVVSTELSNETEIVELDDKRKLGIATLGSLKQHPRISAFRQFIEGWYLSYFMPDAARSRLPLAGPQKHLSIDGSNLGNVVQFMERQHPDKLKGVLERIAARIPGIDKISTLKTPDGRLLLQFNDKGFQDPFYAQQMSDGTLKVFAYLLLLEDPTPPPFLCIEEPENGLYHKLLEVLATEFRRHAEEPTGSQVFLTTHQPYLLDALSPEEVWVLEKGDDGFTKITRASDIPVVKSMADEGLPLGGLWYSDYLDAR